MTISKNIKKILVSGAALLMFASIGAVSTSNVNVSAKHVRTHRIYRHHSNKALRNYYHKHSLHKYHTNQLSHRKALRHYRGHKLSHRRNVHKVNVRRYGHRKHQHIIRARKNNHRHSVSNKWSVDPSDTKLINEEKPQSVTLNLPKRYYGNYFDGVPGKKGIYSFIHLAKHGSYAMGNPDADEGPQRVYSLTQTNPYVKNLGYDLVFDGSVAVPMVYNKTGNTFRVQEYMGQWHTLIPVSERQGIHYFEKYNNYHVSDGITTHDY